MINSVTAKENLKNKIYDALLEDIYVDKSLVDYHRERYIKAIKQYETLFCQDEISVFSAPGRSEVCGNHTDHQHGKVLATSINLDTIAVVAKNNSNVIKLVSDGYDMATIDIDDLEIRENEAGNTESLIRGVLKGLKDRGYAIGGFNAYTTSDVLVGSGLSSSAAFENVIGTIISGLFNDMSIDPVVIAQVSQFAENVYFKKPCGLMDQMACSVGGMINIDFKDPEKPIVNKIDVDFEKHNYSLCIVDTKGSHVDLTDDYAMIPLEMKKVANYFGKEVLRECDSNEFFLNLAEIRKEVGDRAVLRAFHFFREEKNVDTAVEALKNDDFDTFLKVIKKSGNSSFKYLQNVYASRDIQNQNVSIALALSGELLQKYGVCRVHGGGFAGTIQAFVYNDFVETYRDFIDSVFGKNSCHILKVRKHGSIQVI